MDDFLDREFQVLHQVHEPEAQENATRHGLFICMLALSLALHLVLAPLVLVSGKRAGGLPFASLVTVTLDSLPSLPPPQQQAAPSPDDSLPETPAAPQPAATTPAEALPTESQQLLQQVNAAVAGGQNDPVLLEQMSLGLGLSLGYFSSIAEGKTLRDDIRQYYFALLRRINEQWWLGRGTPGGSPSRVPVVNIVISRRGEIIERRFLQSSGDREYDRKILQALDAAAPFPALPESYHETFFQAPIRMVAPLNFLLPGSADLQGHS
jgi:periplasmic protein TonB